jgi:hypothetical protein
MAWRNPVFIDRAITSVVTPAVTPTIASRVTSRSTAGRFGDRKYRKATSHSNLICFDLPIYHSTVERAAEPAAALPTQSNAVRARRCVEPGLSGHKKN